MAQQPPPRLYDGFTSLSRGMHSGRARTLLTNDHVAFATNTTFRGDLPHPRPGWNELGADLSACTGLFQGAAVFEPISGDAHILASIGGHIWKIEVVPTVKAVTDVSISGDANAGNIDQAYFAQLPGWMVIQDGQTKPLIWDGSGLRRSDTSRREVPVGTIMTYGNGRLWVALPDRRSFVAGDLIYSDSGSPAHQLRDSVLKFTENEVVYGGGAFGVPVEAGDITGMKFVGVADTSTGQGPLLVGTERSTFSVNAPFDRTLWGAVTSPIQTVTLPNGGPTGPWSMAGVNGDVWYRDRIGIRSVQSAYRDFGRWTNTPLSRPMRRIMGVDDRRLLRWNSTVEFDNRLLSTVTPQREANVGILHLGLAVLDFDQVSDSDDIGVATASPVWDGLWVKSPILQLVTGRIGGIDRCFAFTWNSDTSSYELWELSMGDLADDDGDEPIVWTLETPEYPFGAPNDRKDIKGAKLWFRDMSGDVTVKAEYSPDAYPAWQAWDTVTLCAPTNNCDTDACSGQPYLPQARNPISLPEPPGSCRSSQRLPSTTGYVFQAKLTVTGQATISRFRMEATPVADDRGTSCLPNETCESIVACPDNPFEYLD